MNKPLSELLREPANHGWQVLNLFQMPGGWRCNLTGPQGRSTGFTEFADGKTPEEAVTAALQSMHVAIKRGFFSAEEQRAMKVFENAVHRLARALGAKDGAF